MVDTPSSLEGDHVTISGVPPGRPAKSCSSSASVAPDSPTTLICTLPAGCDILTSRWCCLRSTFDFSTCTCSGEAPAARVGRATADVQSSTRELALAGGATGFVTKPLNGDVVLAAVAAAMEGATR